MCRFRLIPIIFLVLVGLVLTRLFFWQIMEQERLVSDAEREHFEVLEIPAQRGEIKDRNGAVLVGNERAFLVFAEIPKLTLEPKIVAEKMAHIFEEIESKAPQATTAAKALKKDFVADVEEKLKTPGAVWFPLARKVEEEWKRKIEDLQIEGLGFESQDKRFYPEASMAAQLLGFVGQDASGRDKGYFGLEGFYDLELKGKDGLLRQEKDALGRPILLGKVKSIPRQDGRNLILNLDRTVQFIVERRLAEGLEKYGAKGGSVVVMDPKTGGILAMASRPSYDPLYFTAFEKSLFKNPVVSESYEPGSTFKIIVMAAALNEGVVKPETRCDQCAGPRQIGDYTVRTWNNKYFPETTITEVLEHSDNVGMVYVAQKLGLENLLKYLESFGIGEPTGVDLQEEESPLLRPRKNWYPIDLATVAFGQGIAVTPIQMLQAAATIANGGKLLQPQLGQKVIDSQGKVMEIKPRVIRQVIRPAVAKVLTEMMVSAVDKGEAKWAKPQGFRIAGKTGTAQIPLKGHYDEQKTIASFVGFAPADEPRFVMLVTLREPSSSPWGSETAAPLWFSLSRELFTYFGITPE